MDEERALPSAPGSGDALLRDSLNAPYIFTENFKPVNLAANQQKELKRLTSVL